MTERIYLSPPDIDAHERRAVLEALDSGWVTTLGPSVDAFERAMAAYVDVPCAVALSSGTAALHLALLGVGVRPGDEVLVSTLTFVATANAVAYCGATPVFVDSELRSWNMDPALLEAELEERTRSGEPPAAVVVVDVFGAMADYGALTEICERYGVPLVEDAAESLGSALDGQKAGSFGDAAVLSFNGNKIITTSGGGMLLTRDESIARRARHLATQAREPVLHYQHDVVGYNYRLSNVLAAMGTAQLRKLPRMMNRRREIHATYRRSLAEFPGLSFQPSLPESVENKWLTTVILDDPQPAVTTIIEALAEHDIESRPVWKPMHLQPVFAGCRCIGGDVADGLFRRGIALPSGSVLSPHEQDRIITLLRSILRAG